MANEAIVHLEPPPSATRIFKNDLSASLVHPKLPPVYRRNVRMTNTGSPASEKNDGGRR